MKSRSCYKSLRRRAARRSFIPSVSTDTDEDFAIKKNKYIDTTYKQSNRHTHTHTPCSHSQSFNATDFAQPNTLLQQL